MDNLEALNKKAQSSYLAVQNMRRSLPQIAGDLVMPPLVGKIHGGPFLWLAPKGHYEYSHVDPDDGLLMILRGSKHVRLHSPDQLDRMYPNSLGSKGRTIQSQVGIKRMII